LNVCMKKLVRQWLSEIVRDVLSIEKQLHRYKWKEHRRFSYKDF